MAFFNRKLYLNKPREWGPASQVQASIFKNAERAGMPVPTLYYPFWERAGQQVINYGTVGLKSGAATFPAWVAPGLKFTAASFQYIYSDKLPITNGTGSLTMICRANPAATGGIQALMCQRITPGNYKTIGLLVHATNSLGANNDAFTLFCYEHPNTQSGTNYLGFDGRYHTYAGVRPSVGTLKLNVDGKDLALTTSSTPSTTRDVWDINQSFAVGRLGSQSLYYFDDTIDYSTVFAYALSDDQLAYWHDNPYFLLVRQPPVFYSVPSGEPATFNPAWARNCNNLISGSFANV